MVADSGLPLSVLLPALLEIAGAQALEEAALDAQLQSQLTTRGLAITPEHITAERESLLASIATESNLDSAQADQALASIRSSRALGPARFAALLARNAALRMLVAPEITIAPEDIDHAVRIDTGPRVSSLVIVLADEREAADVRTGLLAPPGPTPERLSALARARSLDASARAGGRVGPVNPDDPRVPASLRPILASLPVGELSPVVALDDGYALVLVESREQPPEPTDARRDSLRAKALASLRARQERLAMDRLARRLIEQARIVPLDPSLQWSWDTR